MALFGRPTPKALAPAGVKDAQAVTRSTGLAPGAYGRAYTPLGPGGDVDRFIANTWGKVSWVFRAVNKIAEHAARLQIEVLQGDPIEGEAIDGHPLVNLLNYMASPEESAYFLRHRVSSTLSLSPRGAFVEWIPDRAGQIQSLRLLPPGRTRPIPHATKFVESYEVRAGSSVWTVPAERVLWLRYPHPTDPYRSAPPVEGLGIPIESDFLAALYNLNFLRNDGRPGGILGVKGGMLPADMDELRAYFTGPQHAGEWRVLDVEDLSAVDLATSPRDAQYVEGRAIHKTEILAGMGVPPTVLGDTAGRTFDNADVDREVFWQETMTPHLDLHADGWDRLDGDPLTFVRYKLDGVEALQRAEYRRREELRAEVAANLISGDEYRIATGREPVGLDRLYVGMGLTPVASTSGKVAPVVAAPAPTPIEAAPTAAGQLAGEAKAEDPAAGAPGADAAPPPVTN